MRKIHGKELRDWRTEEEFAIPELGEAIRKDAGLAAELLHHASKALVGIVQWDLDERLHSIIVAGNNMLDICEKIRTIQPVDFPPIAGSKIFSETFAYMLLNRVETIPEAAQHGFRAEHRLEEHLLTATLVLDKAMHPNVPIWSFSLIFSNFFNKVR